MAIRKMSTSRLTNNVWYKSALAGNTAFNPNSYDLIQTVSLSTTSTSISFTGLGAYSEYKDLQVRVLARGDAGTSYGWQWLMMSLNGSTFNRYHEIRGMSPSPSGLTEANFGYMFPITGSNQASQYFGAGIIDIYDFNNTAKNKTVRAIGGQVDSTRRTRTIVGALRTSTAAVTSITFTPQNGGNFVSGTRISLYGVK